MHFKKTIIDLFQNSTSIGNLYVKQVAGSSPALNYAVVLASMSLSNPLSQVSFKRGLILFITSLCLSCSLAFASTKPIARLAHVKAVACSDVCEDSATYSTYKSLAAVELQKRPTDNSAIPMLTNKSNQAENLPASQTQTASLADSIEIINAWARPSMSISNNNSAVYFELHNNSDANFNLTSVECDIANKTEIHQSFVDEKGVSTMRKIENPLVIPAKTNVSFKPGGLHIMLLDLKESLKIDMKIKLGLYFDNGMKKTVEAKVKNS